MLGPHTVTVVRPASRDNWGDTSTGDTETDVSGCFWQPRGTSEQTGGQDTVTVDAFLSMPATADVLPTDRIVFEGVTYEINGKPALHHTPAGPHHYELELLEIKG